MGNAAVGFDRGGFGEYKPGAANRKFGEVRKVPVAGQSVPCRVLTHRRDDHAVLERHPTQRYWREQKRF